MSSSEARTARQSKPETRRPPGVPPLVLGRYRLHRRLGTGAFGTVWMASDERLEREVAVKILARERIVGGRFEREARAAARLAHPGIVTLYEAAVDDDGAYLVSELVRGSTLDDLLAAGKLSDQDIVAIGIALCDALEHAHAEGVVHRDVKPSNVLVPDRPVTAAQTAKLTDFGVARVIGGDSLTLTGDVIGTLAYMAPEQAEGLQVGPSADLYSLALVLYEALTGVNPVHIGTAANRARRLGAHLPPLRRQRRDLPRELGQGIDLALRPRPRERGTVLHLRRALVAAREHVGDEPGIVAAPWTTRTGEGRELRTGEGRELRTGEGRELRTGEGREQRWGQPTGREPPFGDDSAEGDREDYRDQAGDEKPRVAEPWPARGLAALAAAAAAAWLSGHILGSSPLPPSVAALAIAGLTLLMPRTGWLALTAGACGLAVSQGDSGFAVLSLLGLALPVVLLVRRPAAWPLAAGAPALGMIGLAGAWPALAARAAKPWRRAALGAIGWIWLLLAGVTSGRVLYLPQIAGISPSAVWAGSPYGTLRHVLLPLLGSGALAPALVWALAAVVLPWLIRGRSPGLDFVRVVIWSAMLVSATAVAVVAVQGSDGLPTAPSAVVGGVSAGVLALAPSWLASARLSWRPRPHSTSSRGQFP